MLSRHVRFYAPMLILALLCVLASLLVPGTASASTAAGVETRARSIDLQGPGRVEVEAPLALRLNRGRAPTYDEIASDPLLVPRGAPRFIAGRHADEVVDTLTTPPGRYIQPDGSATDVLQQTPHPGLDDFAATTHTHPARIDVNPADPSLGRTTLLDPRPVTLQEILNIIDGTAVASTPRGR